jgi:hypothetical protein
MGTIVWVAAITASLALNLGCWKSVTQSASEKIAEKAIEHQMAKDGQEGKVQIDGNKISMDIKDKDGKTQQIHVNGSGDNVSLSFQGEKGAQTLLSGENAKLPADFPKDVPLYAGAKLDMVMNDPGAGACTLQAKTADPLEKVAAAMEKDIVAQGWTAGDSVNMPGDQAMKMFAFKKADRTISLMLMKEDNVTGITLTLGRDK